MRRPAAIAVALALPLLAALLATVLGGGPGGPASAREGGRAEPLRVVTTTNFITDLARRIGGERVEVDGLMGPGVDPHLYKASAGDVADLRRADLVLYGGLELEGKLGDLFAELGEERLVVPVTRDLPRSALRAEGRGRYDPHVWFDVGLWRRAARTATDALVRADPEHAAEYRLRGAQEIAALGDLDAWVRRTLEVVPPARRVLVTSHDAFHYFGRAYGFRVEAIQGVSTQTEATTADIERVAGVVAERRLPVVFLESSVPRQTVDAVLAAARRGGQPARVGGKLFSDAAGAEGTLEGTYAGMVRHNVRAIAEGLR